MTHSFSKALPVPSMSMARVLAFGYDRLLVPLRASVLRNSGYDVEETFSMEEALERAQSDSIDAVVICHSVPDDEIERLVTTVRETRTLMPILCMRTHQYGFTPATCISVENSRGAILHALQAEIEAYNSPNRSRLRLAS